MEILTWSDVDRGLDPGIARVPRADEAAAEVYLPMSSIFQQRHDDAFLDARDRSRGIPPGPQRRIEI
jgi:hypothetical protein